MAREITVSRTLFDAIELSVRNLIDLMNREVDGEHRLVLSNLFKLKDLLKEVITSARSAHPDQFTAALDKDALIAMELELRKQIEALNTQIEQAKPIEKVKLISGLLVLSKKQNRIIERINNFKEEVS